MKINYVFPHPICEVQLDVDCTSVLKTINELSEEMSDEKSVWQCEVVTSFEQEHVNLELGSRHLDLIEQIDVLGDEFAKSVGWDADDRQNVAQWWFNKYSNGNWQEMHHHGTHEFVAVLYLTPDVVPTTFINPSEYTFLLRYPNSQREDCSTYPSNQRKFKVYPEPGKMVFFPGYMYHSVPFYDFKDGVNYNQNRVTMAFNFSREKSGLDKLKEYML